MPAQSRYSERVVKIDARYYPAMILYVIKRLRLSKEKLGAKSRPTHRPLRIFRPYPYQLRGTTFAVVNANRA